MNSETLCVTSSPVATSQQAQRHVSTQACGKTIIIGEHAVVYGARAVALPILSHSMHLRAIDEGLEERFKFVLGDKPVSDTIRAVLEEGCELLGFDPRGFVFKGSSSLPIGAGLGSSATLCVVVIKTLSQLAKKPLTREMIAALANQLEKRFHGNPSGLDTAVVSYEEPVVFRKGVAPEPLQVNGRWSFVIIDSGIRASTLSMIQKAKPYFTSAHQSDILAKFETATAHVIDGLAHHQEALVASAMLESAELLAEAGVYTTELKALAQKAMNAGALAAKMTGAGGGGAVLALLPSAWNTDETLAFRRSLQDHPLYELQLGPTR